MSTVETAEAMLIVLKRLGKWALWLVAGLFALWLVAFGGLKAKEYIDNRPHRATSYADINLGDTQKQVLYVLGPPPWVLDDTPAGNGPAFAASDGRVADTKDPAEKVTYNDSKEWMFPSPLKRVDVTFDKPGGRVTAIGCFSETENPHLCPVIYGIQDGSSEEEVLAQLGSPGSGQIDGVSKAMRYPQFNLTVYLVKRRVYMLKLSENAIQ